MTGQMATPSGSGPVSGNLVVRYPGAGDLLASGHPEGGSLPENLGLINRRDIAEEMKSLDQEGRAALRRLGVRFGAYHVFVPALIKPAPNPLRRGIDALAKLMDASATTPAEELRTHSLMYVLLGDPALRIRRPPVGLEVKCRAWASAGEELAATVPRSRSHADEIEAMRAWAEGRFVPVG